MEKIKSLYFYFSSLMFVLAIVFASTAFVEAGECYTCTASDQNCPVAAYCGMSDCTGTSDGTCDLSGEMCGDSCEAEPDPIISP